MNKVRTGSARLVLVTLGLLLAACTPGGGGDENPSDVVVWLPADNPGDIEARQQLAEEFMKDNPDIDVKITSVPANGYNEKVFTTVAAGNPPDIFNSGDIIIPTIVSKNYGYDLNEFVEQENFNLSVFYPEVVDGLTFEGKLVGLTDNWDTQVLYYNRDLFDKAGLEYPNEKWTWNDFISAARELTSGEGPTKIYGAYHGVWFAPVFSEIWAWGGDVLNDEGTECLLDRPPAVKAVQSIAGLIQEGTSPSAQQIEEVGVEQFLLSGRAAMAIDSGRWLAYTLQGGRIDWAVAPLPKGPHGRAPFFHISMYAITRNSDSPENAWKFLKYMVSSDAIKVTAENMQGIPSRKKLATSPAFTNDPLVKQHNTLEPFLQSLPSVHPAPAVENFEQYLDFYDAGLDEVWTGEKPAQEGLTQVCEDIEKQIEEASQE